MRYTMTKPFAWSTVATAALVAAAVTGCDNSKLPAVNNNPNAPTSAPAPTLFTSAVRTSVGTWLGSGYDLRDISLLVQYFAENQYISNDRYLGIIPSALNTEFENSYANDLKDFQVVVRDGRA